MAEQQNTANPILSIGYSLGKLHTGMICYLCDLWNEGGQEPLNSLLKQLGIHKKLPERICAQREHMHIDLVILDEHKIPLIAIEMKVDDHEHPVRGGKWQTEAYSELLDKKDKDVKKLFITLGAGEYYHPPYCDQFEWIGLDKFISAVENIPSYNTLIESWKKALRLEKDLQSKAIQNNRENESKYRKGCWNIYVLGHLKEKLEEIVQDADPTLKEVIDPTVYMHGTRPDTILNFGWKGYEKSNFPIYIEICNDGFLRLKICFESKNVFPDTGVKRSVAEALEKLFYNEFNRFKRERSNRNTYKKTKTLLKLYVGLGDNEGLFLKESVDEIALKVIAVLHKLDEIEAQHFSKHNNSAQPTKVIPDDIRSYRLRASVPDA